MKAVLFAVGLLFLSGFAAAADVKSTTFDAAFNGKLSQKDSPDKLARLRCSVTKRATCEFGSASGVNVVVIGSDGSATIESIAARLQRDVNDQAQRRRATLAAITFLGTAMNTLSAGRPRSERSAAQKLILDGALTDAARGEAKVGQFKYVLSFTQADNIRIYIEQATR